MTNHIRNFCIISHIDHGKSTLADRFLEITGTIEKRKMREQFLDQMELERERGITIKLQPVRMKYILDGVPYILNLIDTPGHVDFSYEVSRSLAAVEGAILLVDATKGIQAQTLANLYLAQEQNLVIIPVINKIDLPNVQIEETEEEIQAIMDSTGSPQVGTDDGDIIKISAKEGTNIETLLRMVIKKIPFPLSSESEGLRALIFDSVFDSYKGVIAYVRIINGQIKKGDKIFMMASGAKVETLEVGIFKPALSPTEKLGAGEIGYIATGLKEVGQCRVGDTITLESEKSRVKSLAGYKEPKSMVFASFYPIEGSDFDLLKDALSKLNLNDASLVYEPESSSALGRGFKCGFLGMLHLEIIAERLKREYGLNLLITAPSVAYQLLTKNDFSKGTKPHLIFSSAEFPDSSQIKEISEPWVRLEIIVPNTYLGSIMQLLQSIEGEYKETISLSEKIILLRHETPLREIIIGSGGPFYDQLKSISSGYASMNYSFLNFLPADLVKLDILVAGEKVEAFSRIISRKKVYYEGRAMVKRLKEILPPQLFAVALQAAVGGDIIARENIKVMRKDVTGHLYGGDYTRKRKLLEKQKRGKKKLKTIGRVRIPQEVFLKILKSHT